ncbi:MAG: hypothetical protein IJY81_07045 [Lachnospiraceae bacterium]|nr:hypothetical protein [Lachnospiraceae bacterium]
MKAVEKDFFREIKNTKSRFILRFLIVAFGVALLAGVRASMPDMKISADRQHDKENIMDIKIIDTMGLTREALDKIKEADGVERAHGAYSKDVLFEIEGK